MTTERTPLERATIILTGQARHKAGARRIIKRAFRQAHYDLASMAARMTPEELAGWALSSPGPVLAECVRAMEMAAEEWTRGNNSGDSGTLAKCERQCDWLREDAQTVLALWGITCDFPGLYPSYERAGRTEHENPARLLTA